MDRPEPAAFAEEVQESASLLSGRRVVRRTVVLRQLNRWDREAFKTVTGNQALELLRRALVK